MRVRAPLGTVALCGAFLASANEARADRMDPALGRFLLDRHCISQLDGQGEYYNPASQFRRCRTDDHAFGKLIAQYGAALAPLASHPVRTTGFGGFHFAIQGAYTTIDNEAPYWR